MRVQRLEDLFRRRRSPSGCPLCALCGQEIRKVDGSPARRSRKPQWCGDRCYTEACVLAGHSQVVRQQLWERDRGICAICGRDCGRLEKLFRRLGADGLGLFLSVRIYRAKGRLDPKQGRVEELARRLGKAFYARRLELGWNRDHTWEADHIIPVAEGGAGCGIEGYRTACLICHRAVTRALVRRLAAGRRAGEPQQLDLFEESTL